MPQPLITNSLKRTIDNFSKKPEIAKYLNRNYRIKKNAMTKIFKTLLSSRLERTEN